MPVYEPHKHQNKYPFDIYNKIYVFRQGWGGHISTVYTWLIIVNCKTLIANLDG